MKPKRFPALHYRDFRIWWIGQFISMIGNQMQTVAINWHIYVLTHSAFALGLIGLMRFLPFLMCGVFAGLVVDRFNRKYTSLVIQVLLMALSFLLTILTLMKTITPLGIYLITALYTIAYAFDVPTRESFIANLVRKEHLQNAFSLNVILRETAFVIGPAITGFLIASSGVGIVYILNVLSYLAIIISLLLVRHPGTIENVSATFSFDAIKKGISFVRSTTIIWSTMLLDFFSAFFSEATTLLPIFAKDILQVGPQGLGILYAAPSLGAVVAGLFMAHHDRISRQGKLLLTGIVCYAAGTICFGLSHWFILSCLALLVVGAGDSISTILRNLIRQARTPDHLRGRMVAINMIFYMGGPQLGEFEAGVVAALIGAPLSVIIGGISTLAVVSIMAAKIPILQKYNR